LSRLEQLRRAAAAAADADAVVKKSLPPSEGGAEKKL
jgi:hypothetical protein